MRRDGDWVRLTTQFRGPNACLDIFNGGENNNQPHLTDCANLSGQYWKLSKSNKSVSDRVSPKPSSGASSRSLKCGKNYKLKNGKCVLLQNCGRNAYRNVEGDCRCKKGYRWRGGKCKWISKKKKKKKRGKSRREREAAACRDIGMAYIGGQCQPKSKKVRQRAKKLKKKPCPAGMYRNPYGQCPPNETGG